MRTPEIFRIAGPRGADYGGFRIDHGKIKDYTYYAQAAVGEGWEHVSVTLWKQKGKKWKAVERTCTWAEMCHIKSLFWEDDEAVMQLHPPKEDWVSTHPYCLHLWRPVDGEIPLPHSILVGRKGDNVQSFEGSKL